MKRHLVIPDAQIKPNSPIDHLLWCGEYISEKRPGKIICLGDFGDLPSLCSYDFGKIQFEGRRYKKDIDAANKAMESFCKPMHDYNQRQRQSKHKLYKPEMHMCIGNHEYRITRAIEKDPKYDGFISQDDLKYKENGWIVHNFLKIIELDGVSYSHYFTMPMSGKPIGGSIDNRMNKIGFSFCAGHQQTYEIGVKSLNNGRVIRGLVCGAFYIEDEEYRGPQCNNEFRGIFMLNEVHDGNYSLLEISLDFLCRKYENMPIWKFVKKKYPDIYKESGWIKYQEQYYGD